MHLDLSVVLAGALFGAAVQAHGLGKRRQDVHRGRAAAIERRQERPEDIMRCPLPTTVTATVTVTANVDLGKPSQPVLLAHPASTRAIIVSVEPLLVEKPTSSINAAPHTSSTPSASTKASSLKEAVPTPTGTSKNTSGYLSSYKGKTRGDATFYGTDYKGHNCGLPRKDLRFVAWPEVTYGTADHCGACLKVTGPAGTEVVQVTDKCPDSTCLEGHLDLSTPAFSKIVGDLDIGRREVSWEFTDCVKAGLETGNLKYYWKSGSTQWWAGIQVRGGHTGISHLEVKGPGLSSFLKPERTDYNYFVSSDLGSGPFEIRTTFQDGTVTTDTNVHINSNIEE